MTGLHIVIGILVFVAVLLMIRTSYLNQRMEQIEDYVHDCVTKDRLREVVLASLSGAAEEKQS